MQRLKLKAPDERETPEEFTERLIKELRATPSKTVRGLIRGMPERLEKCLKNDGGRIGK